MKTDTYLEPFALRALGFARDDDSLITQAIERFTAMGMDRHATETGKFLASPLARRANRTRLDACAVHVGLLASRTPERAITVGPHVEVTRIVLARDRPADRALPAVRGTAALRTEQRLRRHHRTPYVVR